MQTIDGCNNLICTRQSKREIRIGKFFLKKSFPNNPSHRSYKCRLWLIIRTFFFFFSGFGRHNRNICLQKKKKKKKKKKHVKIVHKKK